MAPQRTGNRLVQSLTGLFEDVEARGSHLRSVVRRLEVVPADDLVAADLELAVGMPVIAIDRLRFVNGEPWVVAVTHLPRDLVPGLLSDDLSDQSLYALLEHRYGIELTYGRRSVEAAVAHADLAASLGIAASDPVLVLRSVVYGPDRPVETFVAYHRGDRSRFEVTLSRRASCAGRPEPVMRVTQPATRVRRA